MHQTRRTPIAFGDQFYANKQGGGIFYESDIVPFKPKADIVLAGSAYGVPVDTQPLKNFAKQASALRVMSAF